MTTVAKPEIKGNINTLYRLHGELPSDKANIITALSFMSGADTLDVDYLNKVSESGGIYITSNGIVLNDFDLRSEQSARYKLIPTGMKLNHTNTPLFASFIKNRNYWDGAYIGTALNLFKMYSDHYDGNEGAFSDSYLTIFSNDRDIRGFGLNEVLKYNADDIDEESQELNPVLSEYLDTDTTINSLEAAIKKIQVKNESNSAKGKKKGTQHKSKDQRKQERLQAHLNKIKERETIKQVIESNKPEVKPESTVVTAAEKTVEIKPEQHVQSTTTPVTKEATEKQLDSTPSTTIKETKQSETISIKTETTTSTTEIKESPVQQPSQQSTQTQATQEPDSDFSLEETIKGLGKEQATELEKVLDELSSDSEDLRISRALKQYVKDSLTHSIYERLLIKEHWEDGQSRNRLAFYFKGLFVIVFMDQLGKTNSRGNGYLFSKNREVCLVNTNLLDEYGNFIYLIDHTPDLPDFYDKDVQLLNGRGDLLALGFDSEEIKRLPEPVQIVKNKEKLIFNGKIEDFDFNDIQHMNHILNERRYRFPTKYRNESNMYLLEKIKYAIERAIKISISDYKYIIPKYDFTRRKIQFLIPLYFADTIEGRPDLVIVADEKEKGQWQVCTVLYVEDAYDSARLICKPSDTWLKSPDEDKQGKVKKAR